MALKQLGISERFTLLLVGCGRAQLNTALTVFAVPPQATTSCENCESSMRFKQNSLEESSGDGTTRLFPSPKAFTCQQQQAVMEDNQPESVLVRDCTHPFSPNFSPTASANAVGVNNAQHDVSKQQQYGTTSNFLQSNTLNSVVKFTQNSGDAHAIAVQNAKKRISERSTWISRVYGSATTESETLWFPFTEYYACPAQLSKSPLLAEKLDGGKWICGLEKIAEKPRCVVYSFGSQGNFDFETAVHRTAPQCEIHTFDCTYTPKPNTVPPFISYYKLCLSGKSGNIAGLGEAETLSGIRRRLQHDFVDIFKVDIEGHEWAMIDEIHKSLPFSFGQMLVELHTRYLHRSGGQGTMNAKMLDSYFNKLERVGLYLALSEPVCDSCKNHKRTIWLNSTIW